MSKKNRFLDAYFISDLHLGHRNIIEFSRPQFSSIQEHDEFIIRTWNETVMPDDRVFLLGDVAFNGKHDYLARLNGNITLILGNHDYPTKVARMMEIRPDLKVAGAIVEGKYMITHIPVHPAQLEFRAEYNIHGHLHEHNIDDDRYINVSCEQLDFKPTKLRDLL